MGERRKTRKIVGWSFSILISICVVLFFSLFWPGISGKLLEKKFAKIADKEGLQWYEFVDDKKIVVSVYLLLEGEYHFKAFFKPDNLNCSDEKLIKIAFGRYNEDYHPGYQGFSGRKDITIEMKEIKFVMAYFRIPKIPKTKGKIFIFNEDGEKLNLTSTERMFWQKTANPTDFYLEPTEEVLNFFKKEDDFWHCLRRFILMKKKYFFVDDEFYYKYIIGGRQ